MKAEQTLKLWHGITQVSFILLICLLILWAAVWFPPEKISGWTLAVIWIVPLLFPLWGVLKARLYTYAWLQFINMIYFCHAIMYLMTSELEVWVALAELILVCVNFTAAVMCIRITKKING